MRGFIIRYELKEVRGIHCLPIFNSGTDHPMEKMEIFARIRSAAGCGGI